MVDTLVRLVELLPELNLTEDSMRNEKRSWKPPKQKSTENNIDVIDDSEKLHISWV